MEIKKPLKEKSNIDHPLHKKIDKTSTALGY